MEGSLISNGGGREMDGTSEGREKMASISLQIGISEKNEVGARSGQKGL